METPRAAPAASGAPDEERARKTRLLTTFIRAMGIIGLSAAGISLCDPTNDIRVTAAFYVPVCLAIAGLGGLVRWGAVERAAAILGGGFWLLIAFVTLYFGGMKGHNGAVFAVSIMLVGSVINGRAAIAMSVATALWCAFIVALEMTDRLPEPLGAYSPLNAWTALTLTLILISVLLHTSLASLRELNERAAASARERDEALRRSILGQKLEVVGSLASGIAHDFNNLLTVVQGSAQHLRAELGSDDPEIAGALDDIEAATFRATMMTRQLLSFGRPHGDEVGAVDMAALARDFEPMLPRLVGVNYAITVTAPGPCGVRASRSGLEQILLNLVVNARDAMPEGGRIGVEVRPVDGAGLLTVTDGGVGMDAATQDRIFDPFFSTKVTGTGLGLATVHRLVSGFGGAVRVQSELGRGSTFEVRLVASPLQDRAAGPSVPTAGAPTGAERVLLVEDDMLVRHATTRLLAASGYEVLAVASGHEALALLTNTTDFAVVVSDVSMPGLDGEALSRRLAAEHPALAVVLFSGNRVPASDVIAAPRRAFLEKPATRLALVAAIQRARASINDPA